MLCFHGQILYYAIIEPKEYSMEAIMTVHCLQVYGLLFSLGCTCMFINDGSRPNNTQKHTLTKAILDLMLVNAAFYMGIKGYWKIRANSDHSLMLEHGQPHWKCEDLRSFHFSSFTCLTYSIEVVCPDMLISHKWAWAVCDAVNWRQWHFMRLERTHNLLCEYIAFCKTLRKSKTGWIKGKQGNSSQANPAMISQKEMGTKLMC